MRFVKLTAAAVAGAVLLAACGGGGGGGGGSGSAPVANNPGTGGTVPGGSVPGGSVPGGTSGAWLTLTPGTVALTNYLGEVSQFQVRATSSRTFDKPFNVGIVDSAGLVSSQVSVSKMSDVEYLFALQTNRQAAGQHSSSLEIRLCEDDPQTCKTPLPGSPWYLPVSVNVLPLADAQQRFTFNPSPVDLVVYDNEPVSFQLDIRALTTFDVPVYLAVEENGALMEPGIAVSQGPARGQYSAGLKTQPALAQGVHESTLQVRACYDSAAECKKPVVGSPWRVPVKVTVKGGTNLTALDRIPGMSPWSTSNGNAALTGYVPARFEPAAFLRRWSTSFASGLPVSAPVVENGRLFAVRGNMYNNWELVAISEADGAILWRQDIGAQRNVSAPAAANGKVMVSVAGSFGNALQAFDQATGQLLGTTRLAGQSACRRSPTVLGEMVYLENGSNGGIMAVNSSTGLVAWTNTSVATYDACSPAVDGELAYAYILNQVYAMATLDGGQVFSIRQADANVQAPAPQPLVVGEGMGFVIDGDSLRGFDLKARTRAWIATGKPLGQPVLGNGYVFSLGEYGNVVEARAAATGVLQWKSGTLTNWSKGTPYERMALTANLLFVSGPDQTIALDLATHQVVWSYPMGGELAISDRGVLYIAGSNGKIAAVNLR